MTILSSEIFRIDPLTGCKNYLGFLETLAASSLTDITDDHALPTSPELVEKILWQDSARNSSILFLDLCHLKTLNQTMGRTYGDSAIRWMGILLGEESNSTTFRLGGVDFALLLTTGTHQDHIEILTRILSRIEKEAKSLGMSEPAAHIALIQYENSPTRLDSILMQMGEAMIRTKRQHDTSYTILKSNDLNVAAQESTRWEAQGDSNGYYSTRWMSRKSIYQVMEMGRMLDQTQQEAYADAISGLPNMRAALLEMERNIKHSVSTSKAFSILLMDGDNFRVYNNINYAAGDMMIHDMGVVLRNNLRPNDFVARWRSGDEFIAILPNTFSEGAKIVGERFRLAVKEVSQSWRFPTSISIGVASYPNQANDINELVEKAESALHQAKERGKDQVVIFD